MTVFIRVLDLPVDEKAEGLCRAIALSNTSTYAAPSQRTIFETDPATFSSLPRSPFAYWVSTALRQTFASFNLLEQSHRRALVGVATGDDSRYVRLWWEAGVAGKSRWKLFAKGGSYARHFADVHLCIDWLRDGEPIELSFIGARIRKPDFLRPGLTWPRRSQRGFGVRVLPADCIFGEKGPSVFLDGDESESLLALASLMTSASFRFLVELQVAFGSYDVGVIQRTPVPDSSFAQVAALAKLAHRSWSLKRSVDTSNETSHSFLLPRGLNEKVTGLDEATVGCELAEIQAQIDDIALRLYGISAEDHADMEAPANQPSSSDSEENESAGDDDDDEAAAVLGCGSEARNSWLVGVAFGRFDPRLATGERPIPPEPEPFDPLPSRSPGMYPEGEEPADRPDILVDDAGHPDDLTARARAVAERVKVDVPENLRGWLAKDFFPLHIRMYSKSRRKAPIHWQLATPSASYSVWLYIHAFSKDMLFRVQNDYVAPKLAHEERRLEALTTELRDGATAAQRKDLATQEALVEELRAFLAEVKRVSPLWNPDLDDGVIINFAPLWRLVPQNKAWQKELKTTWDALCEGLYDWAHLAMHLWPERVVPKCATDRSLAIAHGLEADLWEEGADGKWRARVQGAGFRVQEVIEALVGARTSAAVKDALKSLLEAPAPSSGSRVRGSGKTRVQGAGSRVRQISSGPLNPDPGTPDAVRQAIAASNVGTSKSEVFAATGLTDTQWNLAINALLAEGSVTKTGAARGTRYHLTTDD